MEHALRSDDSRLTSQLDLTHWPTDLVPGRATRYAADGGAAPRTPGVPGRSPVQAKPGAGGLRIGGSAADDEAVAQTPQGAGRPLPGGVRTKMERSFGVDFTSVRVHEGPQAAAMGAEAYAHGDAVHFKPGAYDPHSAGGQELLGHELAHVVQQRAGRVSSPQGKGGFTVDAGLEAEADAAGARAARGEPAAVAGATSARSTAPRAAQPKLFIGRKRERETTIPTDVAAKVLEHYNQTTLDKLTAWLDPTAPRRHFKDWPTAANVAFNESRATVDPDAQSLLWYGKDSAARNVDPDAAPAPGAGQFRESAESRDLADQLLAKLGEERRKDALGKNMDGWKDAIMVGVMISVLGKKYAAKSGDMTLGFTKAATALNLSIADPKSTAIRGFETPLKDRTKDPIAKAIDSRAALSNSMEVGQAPGKCAMPKLLSAVAASKGDAPESATEKLFAPESDTAVKVKGEGGEVAKHGHGCSVPSCITCRALTAMQLKGAPSRDDVLKHAETGYVEKLDEASTVRNQQEQERVKTEQRTNRNRRKAGKDDNEIVPARVEATDRAETWQSIPDRVAAVSVAISAMIDEAATPTVAPTEAEKAAALWRDRISPAIATLSAELNRDYKVPTYAFPASTAQTLAALRKHVDDHLPKLEDRARSGVAHQFGKM